MGSVGWCANHQQDGHSGADDVLRPPGRMDGWTERYRYTRKWTRSAIDVHDSGEYRRVVLHRLGMLVANVYGVPVSTSMVAVGSISGYGFAVGTLDMAVLGGIVIWWIVASIIGFWCGAVVGRYLYPTLDQKFALKQSEGPLVTYNWRGIVPLPTLGPGTTQREFISTMVVLAIACYMSFSAGASNVANAVAPLVGGGIIQESAAVLLGTFAIGLGAFTIARRTMDSVGNDLTALPLLAATVLMVVASTITTALSCWGSRSVWQWRRSCAS